MQEFRMTKFFWNDTKGLNADIDRHRKQEAEIQSRIVELADKTDNDSKRNLRVYQGFLLQLQQSKARVVEQLGKKK